jgi:hypothetical protein
VPTRVSILSRSLHDAPRKRANSTNLDGNYREKVEGKHRDPLHSIGNAQKEHASLSVNLAFSIESVSSEPLVLAADAAAMGIEWHFGTFVPFRVGFSCVMG